MEPGREAAAGLIGQPLRRREDPRLLRGRGRYVADLHPEGLLHLAVLRSPHAHAHIRGVDLSAARHLPGVVDIVSFAQLGAAARPLPLLVPHPSLRTAAQFPLARDEVRHVGEAVAVVVATSRYLAEDACERIRVDYEPQPAAVGCERALRPGAPRVHDHLEDNLAARFEQRVGRPEEALAAAPVRVGGRFRIGRCSGQPLEGRGLLAYPDAADGLVVWSTTQAPHLSRRSLAAVLGLPERRIRVIAPDVGGGFGSKETFHPEDVLVPLCALRTGRPVRWLEDRREHLQASIHERDQVHEAELGLETDGRIVALVDRLCADTGAYTPWGVVVPLITSTLLGGPFRVPNYLCVAEVAYTHTGPIAPYRGAGRPQAIFIVHRLLDLAARELGLDPAELHRRNFIPRDAFPYDVGLRSREGTPLVIDSGDYAAGLDLCLRHLDYPHWRAEQARARREGRYVGIGFASAIENTGTGPHEGATVRVEPDGRVSLRTGAASQGQGHATVLAQVCAQQLGLAVDDVEVAGGDTAMIALGSGTYASRTAVVAGNATAAAARAVRDKALRLAAARLEARAEDLELAGGRIGVRGAPGRTITLAELAFEAAGPFPGATLDRGEEPGLEATRYFCPPGGTYASGCHAVVVEVDPATGEVRLLRYVAVHDCGTILNPTIVEGQVQGGVAAGIGNALYEEVLYGEDGQLLTGSLADYLLPGAAEIPRLIVDHTVTPSPANPLGVKGAGEGGTIPVPACINAAVDDALGCVATQTPLPPERVWRLAQP